MLARRGLIGLFAAAPAIIAADRLMPVRVPRLVTVADLEFREVTRDHGYLHGMGAQFVLNGTIRRHAVVVTSGGATPTDADRARAKRALLKWATNIRLTA